MFDGVHVSVLTTVCRHCSGSEHCIFIKRGAFVVIGEVDARCKKKKKKKIECTKRNSCRMSGE